MIQQGVIEQLGECVAGVECIHRGVAVVQHIAVGAIGIECQCAIQTLECGSKAARGSGSLLISGAEGHHPALGWCHQIVAIGVVNVAIVADHVAGGICTGCAVEGSPRFDGHAAVVGGHGSVIDALDRDRQDADVAEGAIGDGVVERLTEAGARIKGIHKGVTVVDAVGEAAVGIDDELPVAAQQWRSKRASAARSLAGSRSDAGHRSLEGQRVIGGIGVGVVAQQVAAGVGAGNAVEAATGFNCGARVVHRHRRSVGDQDQGLAAQVVVQPAGPVAAVALAVGSA